MPEPMSPSVLEISGSLESDVVIKLLPEVAFVFVCFSCTPLLSRLLVLIINASCGDIQVFLKMFS